MAEKDRITNPSMGSNELGSETTEQRSRGVSPGTDTQQQLAAESNKKHKADKDINDDEKVVKNTNGGSEFLDGDETDE